MSYHWGNVILLTTKIASISCTSFLVKNHRFATKLSIMIESKHQRSLKRGYYGDDGLINSLACRTLIAMTSSSTRDIAKQPILLSFPCTHATSVINVSVRSPSVAAWSLFQLDVICLLHFGLSCVSAPAPSSLSLSLSLSSYPPFVYLPPTIHPGYGRRRTHTHDAYSEAAPVSVILAAIVIRSNSRNPHYLRYHLLLVGSLPSCGWPPYILWS